MGDQLEKQKRRTTLYAEVYRFSQNSDYDKMLKSCNRLLHEFPEEETAFESKIVACVKLSKFKEALDFIGRNPKLSKNLAFEHAYCCYRVNDVVQAEKILRGSSEDSARKTELLAQIYYRLEEYEKCYDLYRQVIKNSNDEWDSERQTNLLAISACLNLNGIKNNIPHAKGDTFELNYNVGCVLVGKGQYAEAESILTDAEKECVQTLEEDGVPEEEIEDEVSIIRVQRGYCAQKLGRVKEAMHIYTKSLKVKPSDIGLAAVAANNILSLNKDQNIFDSKKRIRTINGEGVENRITRKQLCAMRVNQCLFNLHTNQYDACKSLCEDLLKNNPEAKEEVSLIQAAVVAKTDGIEAAKKLIEKSVSQDSDAALRVRLGLVQQILKGGKRSEAIDLLRNLGKDKYLPGVVSAIVTLYQTDGDRDAAGKLIREAIQYYRANQIGNENMSVLWQQAVALMMEQGDYGEAVKSLEEQYKLQPDNMGILAQLVIAYAKLDLSKAEQLSKRLPNPSFEGKDVATLESPSWQANLRLAKKAQKGESVPTSPVKQVESDVPAETSKKLSKKKKKKKRHIPAHLDPTITPDPERWMPKYERSGYKPKKTRSKGKVDVGKGTQGATSEAAAQFDMSAKVRAGGNADSSAGDGPAVSVGGARKDHNKKKKKKR